MAKSIKLKCVESNMKLFFTADKLYAGKIDDDGNIFVKFAPKGWHKLDEKLFAHGETTDGEPLTAQFVQLKTKTIKCTWVNHSMQIKKTFKPGKRYQVEQGRVLGAVAGYVFDENGDRFTLYREEVGFSAAGGAYLFEAKYS